VDSCIDDVMLTRAFTGLDANMLRPSIIAAGLEPQTLAGTITPEQARARYSEHSQEARGPKRWVNIWSAGHTVSAVATVQPVATLVHCLAQEYAQARQSTAKLLST